MQTLHNFVTRLLALCSCRTYSPLSGAAEVQDGGDGSIDKHQVSWIAEEWWRSSCSAMAGDRVGLLLDLDEGTVIAHRNGVELGTLFTGLPKLVTILPPWYILHV